MGPWAPGWEDMDILELVWEDTETDLAVFAGPAYSVSHALWLGGLKVDTTMQRHEESRARVDSIVAYLLLVHD